MKKVYLVSACLAGARTRFDGGARLDPELLQLVREGRAVPVCPEQLGGLATPRPPAEILGGDGFDVLAGTARVVTCDGQDVTAAYLKGAEEILRLAQTWQAAGAVLKARSPACGSGEIYDGSFQGSLKPGFGVAAALLAQAGLPVFSEKSWRDSHGSDQYEGKEDHDHH
ncbi:MAG: DUF523 domain-containing protein [Firmicutes bacterium]|nr:DUF523 domain-containing protein [Bacillota bacterium]